MKAGLKDMNINLFEYRDYRTFLKEFYQKARNISHSYSFRALAKRAGFKSSNFFMLVMQGKRNLTEDSLHKVMRALNLNKQEEDFFRNLVFFNQATSYEDKNLYYQRLVQSKKIKELKPIEKKQYEYYSAWYHPVIRELVIAKDFDGTPEWISKKLFPTVTTLQVSKSIELLEALNLIVKDGQGKWRQKDSLISTGPELTSVVVHNYHKILLNLSQQVMDKLSMKEREVSSLTLGVSKKLLPEITTKIREFRQELLKMVAQEAQPEEVALLNIQFYPVTQGAGEKS